RPPSTRRGPDRSPQLRARSDGAEHQVADDPLRFRLGAAQRLARRLRRGRPAPPLRPRRLQRAARARRGRRPAQGHRDARLCPRLRADPVGERDRGRRPRPRGGAAGGGRLTYRLVAEALESAAGERGKLAKIARLADALAPLDGARLAIAGSEEHTSELPSLTKLVCRLLL